MTNTYDYESYFSKKEKLDYWKAKQVLDEKYLVGLVDSAKYTLNAGSGLFVEKELLKIKTIICIDISNTAIKKLKSKGVNAIQGNLLNPWKFKDQEFEQVLLLDIFEHLGQIDFFMQELYRVTKKKGVIILGIPLLNHWRNHLKLLLGSTKDIQYDEHIRMFFDSDIKRIFGLQGFGLVSVDYIGLTKGYGYYKFLKLSQRHKGDDE